MVSCIRGKKYTSEQLVLDLSVNKTAKRIHFKPHWSTDITGFLIPGTVAEDLFKNANYIIPYHPCVNLCNAYSNLPKIISKAPISSCNTTQSREEQSMNLFPGSIYNEEDEMTVVNNAAPWRIASKSCTICFKANREPTQEWCGEHELIWKNEERDTSDLNIHQHFLNFAGNSSEG